MCVCVDFIRCIVRLSSRGALYVLFFSARRRLCIARCAVRWAIFHWALSVGVIRSFIVESLQIDSLHFYDQVVVVTLHPSTHTLTHVTVLVCVYYLNRSEYEPLRTGCGFGFACCLLYKLIWNAHLSALMWHPDQMVFHVMTDHRRRRRCCRYTTHLYNILY